MTEGREDTSPRPYTIMEISRHTVFKSLFWKFFERLGTQSAGFIVSIILARLLMPEQYGTIALIMIFINICNVIIDGGLNTALIQKKQANDTDFSTILYTSLLISVALYCLLFACAPLIAGFYRIGELTSIIRVLGVNLLFYSLNSIQRAYVSKHMLFNKLFYSSLLATIISGLIGILMAYAGWGVWALVALNLSGTVITCVTMWYSVRWRPMLVFSTESFRGLFNYGWKIFMTSFITVIFVEMRKMCIGKLYTPRDLAYYEKGEQFPNLIMTNIFTSIQSILLPTFSEYQDDRAKVKNMMRSSTKMSCFVIYPLMTGMMVTAPAMIHMLLGDKWMNAVPFIQIMCIAFFFRPITISNWEAIKAMGYSDITLKLEIVKKVIDIIILIVAININVLAIAWGVVLYDGICIIINLAPNARLLNYRIHEQVADAMPPLLISLAMGAIIYPLCRIGAGDLIQIILQIIAGIAAYTGLCYMFKEESLMYLLSLVRQRRAKGLAK